MTVVVVADPAARAAIEQGLAPGAALPVPLRFAVLPGREAVQEPATGGRFASALVAARAHYVEAEFEACLSGLPDDAAVLEALARQDARAAARVLLWRVACEVGRGGTAAAQHAAQRFATLSLEPPPEIGTVAPDAERVIVDALQAGPGLPRCALHADSKPPQRALAVDGRPRGCATPCRLTLPCGEHVLSLSGEGSAPRSTLVQLAAPQYGLTLELDAATPELARAQWAERYGPLAEVDRGSSLRLLALALPAARLLVIRAEPVGRGRELYGALVLRGDVVARDRVQVAGPERLGGRARALARSLLVRGELLPPRPLWRNPWLWTTAGVVAAAAVVTTALLLREPAQRTEVRFE